VGFPTLKWLGQEKSYIAALYACKGKENVKPAIVFQRKGNMSTEEKAQYDEGLDVYFQSCAWMDSEIKMQWVAKTLALGFASHQTRKLYLQTI